MSDTEIMRTVYRLLATLMDDLDLVQVEVEQGVVYLEGIAVSATQKQHIDRLVLHLPGVRQVVNCLSLEHVAHLEPDPGDAPLVPSAVHRGSRSAQSDGYRLN